MTQVQSFQQAGRRLGETLGSPAWLLLGAGVVGIAGAALAVMLALSQPWLGLSLEPDASSGGVRVVASVGEGWSVPAGSRLVAVGDGTRTFELRSDDLLEEPDFFDRIPESHRFFERQGALAEVLASDEVELTFALPDARVEKRIVRPTSRPLSSLPFVFWVQVSSGSFAFLVGLFVFTLRRGDPGARMFALTGVFLPFASHTAAVYSTRELALPAPLFRVLGDMNVMATALFGCAFVAMFFFYPRVVVAPRKLWGLPAVVLPWIATGLSGAIESTDLAVRLPLLLMMCLAIGAGFYQWWVGRDDPRARAALRWLGISSLLGVGLFVFGVIGAAAFGEPSMPQGHAFAFFFIMNLGLAVGLMRHRLFELESWSIRILLWVLGALSLIAFDAALVLVLKFDTVISLALSLFALGFVYFPVRNLLWNRMVVRRKLPELELFGGVLDVAFASTPSERGEIWHGLLRTAFEPLELSEVDWNEARQVRIRNDGLLMHLPPVGTMSAVALSMPWGGRGLFTPHHQRLAARLIELLERAEASRDAYDRGVLEERTRVARSLHDDLGATLLSGLHRESLEDTQQAVRRAIDEMRVVVGRLSGRELQVGEMLAELRSEAQSRLEAAGIDLDWPVDLAPPPAATTLTVPPACQSIVREAVSNVIRHSKATCLKVGVAVDAHSVRIELADDGVGMAALHQPEGFGLQNMKHRAEEAGGTLDIIPEPGTTVVLTLPLGAARRRSEWRRSGASRV